MAELIDDLLENAPKEHIRLYTELTPAELWAVRPDGRAAHQLWSDSVRMVVSAAQDITERQFKHKVGMQIATILSDLADRRIGVWRVVGVSIRREHRMRWTRKPTGLSRAVVEREDDRADPEEARQMTKPVEVKDPVLMLDLALAETTGAGPVDQAWEREGKQTSMYYRWIQDGAPVRLTPPRERRAREKAIELIAATHGVTPSESDPALTEEAEARVLALLKLKLTPTEVAGAVGASLAQIEKLKRSDRAAKELADAEVDAVGKKAKKED